VREKYEATKVLEIDNKVKELKRTHKWLLATLMPLNQNDRSPIRILVLYEKHEKYQEC
jgi:hypothetical protein